MLKIVTFLWGRGEGHELPHVCDYTHEHVNVLESMLARNLHAPHELICITDMPEGVRCRTIPLWDKCRNLGGCYNRLYLYSADMRELIGERFACIDLDCVITGDVTPIFTRPEPFLIHEFSGRKFRRQRYNGSLVIMDAGIHDHVWRQFDPHACPEIIERDRRAMLRIGTDQAWVSMQVPDAETIGPDDGVYEARDIVGRPPPDARIVFFSGRRDPTQHRAKWVKEHWQ